MNVASRVRACVYRHFAEAGSAPRISDIATALSLSHDKVEDAFTMLATDHLLVLAPDGRTIERAGPFSGSRTSFRVRAGDGWWWGNCAWDALAIPPMLGVDAIVETSCGDCAEPMTIRVSDGGLSPVAGFVHVARPARRWWDDIRFT